MLCKGTDTADTFFEPYTGGQPSPSPEFPQKIKTITDSLIVTSCWKNLVGKMVLGEISPATGLFSKATSAICNENYILYDNLKQYYIKVNNAPVGANIRWYNQKFEYIGYGSARNDGTINKGVSTDLTLHIPNDTIPKYFKIRQSNTTLLNSTWCISTDQNYFGEYFESLITVNLPEGEFIGKIDDTYKDTLSVDLQDDGKYHLLLNKMVGKRILNSGDMSSRIVLNTGDIMYRTMKLRDISINKVFTILCNRYVGIEKPANRKDGNIYWNSLNRTIDIIDNRANITTIDEFKTWLSTHNLEVYYVLENPYKVDLGIVDMPFSYDEVTNIFTDSELLPKINATYYRNFISTIRNLKVNNETLKNELVSINNRLAVLENANVSAVNDEVIEESEVTEK